MKELKEKTTRFIDTLTLHTNNKYNLDKYCNKNINSK